MRSLATIAVTLVTAVFTIWMAASAAGRATLLSDTRDVRAPSIAAANPFHPAGALEG
jgi:hypothetical protein